MPAFIHHIATEVPTHVSEQTQARDRMKGWAAEPKTRRLIQAIYNRSGIERRHSVCPDFTPEAEPLLYLTDDQGLLLSPSTGRRNQIYAQESHTLATAAGRRLLEKAIGFAPADITHVIFASCTGFTNPGPDYHLIRDLGLSESVERYTLGFMGCYAAFPALRMASQFCAANPQAVVLVMCLELCTLHLQMTDKPDDILAHSLFADGAAAALVSARPPTGPAWRLHSFESALLPTSETDMAWDIGDHGFNIVLSSYVPELIGANIQALLTGILNRQQKTLASIRHWAVHPGGRSILDKVEQSLELPPEALQASRSVLRDFGNMSSATILFVLARLLEQPLQGLTSAVAFGPGLTVETALLERV
ncbi:MAG: type III polyketide synthase [Verrucomicrobiota bacterium]